VFAAALILKEPLPVRFAGDISDMVSHDISLLCTLQVVFEVTPIVLFPALSDRCHSVDGFNASTAGAACDTAIVRLGTPGAVTVIVPDLGVTPVLAAALILNEPLPVRLAGDIFDMVSHVTLLLTPQVVLDVTLIVLFVAGGEMFHAVDGFNVSVGGTPSCVTIIVRVETPGAVTAIVPALEAVPVLAVTFILNEPSPVRFAGDMFDIVNHDVALLVTVHCLVELTRTKAFCATGVGFHTAVDKVSAAGAAAWVTEIVRVVAPGAATVIVPVLDTAPIWAVALILNEPLPVRFAGNIFVIVSHDVSLLVTVHVLLEFTLTSAKLAPAKGVQKAVVKVSVAGAASWVTEIVRVVAPGAVTVIVPVLGAVPVLAVAFILNEPLPVRSQGDIFDIVSHDVLLLVTVHCLLEVTLTKALVALYDTFHVAVDRLSVGGAAA